MVVWGVEMGKKLLTPDSWFFFCRLACWGESSEELFLGIVKLCASFFWVLLGAFLDGRVEGFGWWSWDPEIGVTWDLLEDDGLSKVFLFFFAGGFRIWSCGPTCEKFRFLEENTWSRGLDFWRFDWGEWCGDVELGYMYRRF